MAITTSSSSSILKWILDPKKNFLAAMHKSSVDHRLRKYGLTTYSSFSLSSNLLLQISSPIEAVAIDLYCRTLTLCYSYNFNPSAQKSRVGCFCKDDFADEALVCSCCTSFAV
ncbi:hypothetical protein vseg_021239 [Gypsophila vaccaria]